MEQFTVMADDYIRFVYSLSFVVLASVSFLMLKIQPSNRLWRGLSLASIFYASGLFCDIFRAFLGYVYFSDAKLVLILLAFYCLFEYSRRETNDKYKTTIKSWWFLACVFIVVAVNYLITGTFDFIDVLKCFIGAPVYFWTATMILILSGAGGSRYSSIVLSLMFFVFGVLQTQIDTSQVLYKSSSIIHLINAVVVLFASFILWRYFHVAFREKTKNKERPYVTMIVFLVALFLSWLFIGSLGKNKEQELESNFISRAKIVAATLSFDNIQNLKGSEEDLKNYDYQRIKASLAFILKGEKDARFLYLMGQKENKIIFYVDAEPETSKDYASPGSVYDDFPKALLSRAFIGGEAIVNGPYTDKWGTWVSSFVPIKDVNTKKVIAVLGMDINSSDWSSAVMGHRLFAVSLSMLVSLLLLILNLSRYLSKISRDALKESQELFNKKAEEMEHFFNVSVDLLNITDSEGRFVRVSNACEKILGYKSEELQNKRYIEMVHPDDIASTLVEAASLSEDKPVLAFTNRYRKKDGSYAWIEWHSNPQENGFIYSSARDITDRYLQKERVEKNNLLLVTQQDVSLDGILSVDEEGKIISYNKKFIEMWGIPHEVIESRSDELALKAVLEKLVAPQEFLEKVKKLYENKREKDRDEIYLVDGRVLDRYSAPMFNNEGRYYGRVWFFRDITKEKETRKLLENRERYFREVLDFLQTGVAIIDKETLTLVDINPAALKILKKKKEDVIGQSCHKSVCSPHCTDCPIKDRGEKVTDKETAIRNSDGVNVPIIKTAIEVVVNGRECILESFIDVTAIKQAELALKRLSRAVEQSPATVVVTDINGAIEYVNPKFTSITGYTPQEAQGQNPRILKSGELSPDAYKKLWDTITTGKEWRGEFHNKRKDGSLFWEAASIGPIMDEKGKIINYLAVKEDITQRKETEQELVKAQEKLVNVMKVKDEFLAVTSHDLKSPFGIVKTSMSLLLDESNVPDQVKEYAQMSLRQANRGIKLITDLLDIKKLEDGNVKLELKKFKVSTLVQGVLDDLKINFEQNNISVDFINDREYEITADYARLGQVLNNLLDNALKYTSKNGKIKIMVSEKDGLLRIGVQNFGQSIPADQLSVIFEKYEQSGSMADRKKGHGIGLSIVKMICALHGGKSWAESQEGKNPSVTFYFEIPNAKIYSDSDHQHKSLSMRHIQKTILVVDDLADERKIAGDALRKAGFNVVESEGWESALKAIRSLNVDAVVLDIEMPEINGLELLEIIRREKTMDQLPVLLYSSRFNDLGDCSKYGANDYVNKSSTGTKTLLNKLKDVLKMV